eukprot:13406-Heterococcus_DN1.PRE.1
MHLLCNAQIAQERWLSTAHAVCSTNLSCDHVHGLGCTAAARYWCYCSESAPVDEGAYACAVLCASLCYSAQAGHCMTNYSKQRQVSHQKIVSISNPSIASPGSRLQHCSHQVQGTTRSWKVPAGELGKT